MRIIAPLLLLLLFIPFSNSLAQKEKFSGDPHVPERFAAAAANDPAYQKFKAKLEALVKSANGTNTNAAAVKALFGDNSGMLDRLYDNNNIERPAATGGMKIIELKRTDPIATPFDKLRIMGSKFIKTEVPVYDAHWRWTGENKAVNLPDISLSQAATGKTAMVYKDGPIQVIRPLGRYYMGSFQTFKVPQDPLIIAAEVKFEYSYLYTAWDTYGSSTGVELLVRANIDSFFNPALSELPVSDKGIYNNQPNYYDYGTVYCNWAAGIPWRVARVVQPRDTVTSNIQEWHASENNGTFVVKGNVIPGTTIKFDFGIGYMINTQRGLNGNYHYLDCQVKKITVTYLKTAN